MIKMIKYFLLSLVFFNLTQAKDKNFVVIICSYNNAKFYKKNLDSVFSQKYKNYRVIYVDDGSSDSTVDLVKQYVKTHKVEKKFTLIQNAVRQRKAKNIYNVYRTVDDKDVIVQLDGDDWFAHDKVLATLNQVYSNPNVWLTYGSFANSNKTYGYALPVSESIVSLREFRKVWVFMHLRSFYSWLFKCIKLEDCITETVSGFKGKFYPASNDLMMMYPMLEMAGDKFKYMKEILYIRNYDNPISGLRHERSNQIDSAKEIKAKNKYTELSKPIINRLHKYKNARSVCLSKNVYNNKKNLLKIDSDYVVLVLDGKVFNSQIYDEVLMSKHIMALEDTYSLCLFINTDVNDLTKKSIVVEWLRDNIYCFKFNICKNIKKIFKNSGAVLFRKTDLIDLLNNCDTQVFDIQKISKSLSSRSKVGLCCS